MGELRVVFVVLNSCRLCSELGGRMNKPRWCSCHLSSPHFTRRSGVEDTDRAPDTRTKGNVPRRRLGETAKIWQQSRL